MTPYGTCRILNTFTAALTNGFRVDGNTMSRPLLTFAREVERAGLSTGNTRRASSIVVTVHPRRETRGTIRRGEQLVLNLQVSNRHMNGLMYGQADGWVGR